MKLVLQKTLALAMDSAMCGMMNALQWRKGISCTSEELEAYLTACADQTREDFYLAAQHRDLRQDGEWISWDTPHPSGFLENDRTRVRVSYCAAGPKAPTVLILHALMSASDIGYRRLAKWFNDHGWNAVFPHLPYHYSRKPKGYFNGELAITANLIHNGETLRQGVMELRQLMVHLRQGGCEEFGILGTSYGGWTGALLSFLEPDMRFLALIQPIVDVESAIWESPGSVSLRRQLLLKGIAQGQIVRHAHLSSPLHGVPLCGGERVIITAGSYDSVSPARHLATLTERWKGARLIEVRQGHFGYAALPETQKALEPWL